MNKSAGKVYLVGAGPGDPGLITARGLRYLRKADVVIYDHLANDRLLDDAPLKSKKINVGKRPGKKVLEQREINRLLIREARNNRVVVRLKGGDPFIFGRGGEEATALAEAAIPFEVVPGVTSAIASPAYAGIPLTHRGWASSVAIATGHEDPDKDAPAVDFEKIARSVDTIVCLMGVKNMNTIIERIRKGGKPDETPVAIIERGTSPRQKVVAGTLKDIVARAGRAGVNPPAVIVTGDVVRLRHTAGWFNLLPLSGKTIVVTRPKGQAESFANALEEAGARVIHFPTIEIIPPRSFTTIDRALNRLEQYSYLVFTSSNGVASFYFHMHRLEKDLRVLDGTVIAALGPVTARALRDHLLFPEIVPDTFTSGHLAGKFTGENLTGKKVLFFGSSIAGDTLPRRLVEMGARVDRVAGYTVRRPRLPTAEIKRLFRNGKIDLITFTSPSTFKNFAALMGREPIRELLKRTTVAAIGPVTRREIVRRGVRVAVTATSHTVPHLLEAIMAYYQAIKKKR